jgi:hypothetical protein
MAIRLESPNPFAPHRTFPGSKHEKDKKHHSTERRHQPKEQHSVTGRRMSVRNFRNRLTSNLKGGTPLDSPWMLPENSFMGAAASPGRAIAGRSFYCSQLSCRRGRGPEENPPGDAGGGPGAGGKRSVGGHQRPRRPMSSNRSFTCMTRWGWRVRPCPDP